MPLILAAGRTPITEKGSFGSRSRPIQWGQEMFDQAGMVRELVKWDYELRMPGQVGDVVTRGVEVAMAHPRGPVYLMLPREPLSATLTEPVGPTEAAAASGGASPGSKIDRDTCGMDRGGRTPIDHQRRPAERLVSALGHLAERCAIPVISHSPRTVCLPSSHAMHFGFEPGALLTDADLVLVLESDVPWIPHVQHPPGGCRVAHIGEDPFYVRYPMRSFPSDLAVQAGTGQALEALSRAVEPRLQMAEARIAARRARLTERMRTRRAQLAKDSAAGATISPEFLSRAIGETVGKDAIIFNEYPLRPDHCPREKPGTFFALGSAGGLGWGFGAALGAKLAAPDNFMVATLGDGAYMFANPMVGHWMSGVHNLPILTIVFNNSRYGAVRRATLSMFKDGVAGENDGRTLADLDPSPAFEDMARAQGAHAERVEKPADLPDALARARDRRRQRKAAGADQRHYTLLNRLTVQEQSKPRRKVHAHRRLYPFHSGKILQQDR